MSRYFAVRVTRTRTDLATVNVEVKDDSLDGRAAKDIASDEALDWLKSGGTKTWIDQRTDYSSYSNDVYAVDLGVTVDKTV
jgi:hypothetical protein